MKKVDNINNEKNIQNKNKKIKILRTIISICIALAFIILTIKFYPFLYNLKYEQNRIEFEKYISNMGYKGALVLVGLQTLQIVVAILPGQPIEIVAGMLYGQFWGTVICTAGIFIGTTIVYFLVKLLGEDFVLIFVKNENLEKFKNMKIMKNKRKLIMFLFVMFFVPIFPKDMFVYLGGFTILTYFEFITLATLSRIPGQYLGVYVGAKLIERDYIRPIIVLIVIFIASVIFSYVYNKKHKKDDEVKQ